MATKSRHLKTPLQLWIADNRKRVGLSPADLGRLTGVTEDTARGWESRGRPSEDALAVLERRFGEPAPREAGQAATGDLAAALLALADELRASREERQALRTELDALRELVMGLSRATAPGTEQRVEEIEQKLLGPARKDLDEARGGSQSPGSGRRPRTARS